MDGVIRMWNTDRGFGFVRPHGGRSDVFVHVSSLPPGVAALAVGQAIRFTVIEDGRDRRRATAVELIPPVLDPDVPKTRHRCPSCRCP